MNKLIPYTTSFVLAGTILLVGHGFLTSAEFKCSLHHGGLLLELKPEQVRVCIERGVIPIAEGQQLYLQSENSQRAKRLAADLVEKEMRNPGIAQSAQQQQWNQEQDDQVQREQSN